MTLGTGMRSTLAAATPLPPGSTARPETGIFAAWREELRTMERTRGARALCTMILLEETLQ
jgi:hypothetical protein